MGQGRKTAVVTGSSQGLGKAIAAALLERGINVVISSSSAARSRRALADLRRNSPAARIIAMACDIRSRSALERLAVTALGEFGQVDIWVNNAGLALGGSLLAATPEADWRAMVDRNLYGGLLASQTAATVMGTRGGALYNVLGAGADGKPVPGMGAYATTKAAMAFLTKSLATELAGSPVLVGGLSPGLVITEGFLREHAKMPGGMRPEREKVVNLIADHPETVGRWAAKIVDTNNIHGRTFHWLTPAKLRRRRAAARPRDILSQYLAPP